nr:hypothetical protein [Fonticella tunisiensis]
MMIIKKYGEYDITKLKFIGKGMQGSVYKIDDNKCIKIFESEKICKQEVDTLNMAQGNPHFPRIFSWGKNFIVREYVDGIELDKYLKENPLTLDLSEKMVRLYEAMVEVGYKRCDAILFHIFLTKDGSLRMIDTARMMKKTVVYPKIMMEELDKLGYKDIFLSHVKMLRPSLYELWKHNKQIL